MNVLVDPVLSVTGGGRVTLPGLFAAMASGRARGLPAIRPHQRPAWHMFLVQLGALAAWRGAGGRIPESETAWTDALRQLTPEDGDDAPWRLSVYDGRRPAFLQPPEPDQAKWTQVGTPDELDMLITARNHDLKNAVAKNAEPEDWIYALVSLQTCEGYSGGGNYGIARMNGGSSSRPMLGLAPAREGDLSLDLSAWWRRDVERLLEARRAGEGGSEDVKPALLWCLEWPGGEQLRLEDLDPWFIEVCRRVRLGWSHDRLSARRATSKKARIDARRLQGRTGDPWAPVHREEGKALTLGSGDFGCERLCELLFSGDWELPLLCRRADGESGAAVLVAEAFSRGNIRTDGFRSRIVPVPEDMASLLGPGTPAAALAKEQMGEIQKFDRALRDALALMAAGGGTVRKEHYSYTFAVRDRFRQEADRLFFESLWRRVRHGRRGRPRCLMPGRLSWRICCGSRRPGWKPRFRRCRVRQSCVLWVRHGRGGGSGTGCGGRTARFWSGSCGSSWPRSRTAPLRKRRGRSPGCWRNFRRMRLPKRGAWNTGRRRRYSGGSRRSIRRPSETRIVGRSGSPSCGSLPFWRKGVVPRGGLARTRRIAVSARRCATAAMRTRGP